MTEQSAQGEQPVKADRDISSVSRRFGNQFTKIAILVIGGVALAGLVVWNEQRRDAPMTFIDPDDDEFETSRGSTGQPFIIPERTEPDDGVPEAETEAEPTESGPNYDPLELERLRAELERQRRLEEEGLRLARERQARLAERVSSPQLVVTSGALTAPPPGAQAASFPGANGDDDDTPQAPPNANQSFFDHRAALGVQTSRATRFGNPDAIVPQGTLIGAILESAIQSNLPGQIRAIVSENTYSMDQSRVLIPRGSRLIGSYSAGIVHGQTRVFVVWERLLRSDGVSIQVGSSGSDQLGRSGVEGFVDTHFLKRFGSAILLSLIDGAIDLTVAGLRDGSGDNNTTIIEDSGDGLERAAEIALENSINIPPTIFVDQGARIKVFVGRDLDFGTAMN